MPMPLRATSADGSAFTSSVILTSAGHPTGVAYMAGWKQGASLRIASLDLASGKPLFPVVDLGAWKGVYQLAARPEGVLVAGLQTMSPPHADQREVHFVALDPSTGRVRWEDHARSGPEIPARLYPYGVLAVNESDAPALLDWTTGTPRWTLSGTPSKPSFIDNALPAVTGVEPRLTAPLAAAAELDTPTPDDPRLALHANGDWVLDTRTGDWTEVNRNVDSGPTLSATPVLLIGESVYLSANSRSGGVLYRFPADPPQPVEHGDTLWSDHGRIVATTPCGPDRLCLTEGPTGHQTGQRMVLVDTASRQNRALPDTVPTGGYAIGDRYVDPAGRVYDLTGALLGESSPLTNAWWLTPGSLVGIDQGDPARTVGATPHATIVAVSTVDGRRTVLDELPAAPVQVTTANGYLVYAADDGFHVLQYAQT